MYAQALKKNLVIAIEHGYPVLITGQPGIGKTDIVGQATEEAKKFKFKRTDFLKKSGIYKQDEIKFKMLTFHPAVSEPTDYKGQPWVLDGKADFLPYGDLRSLIEADSPTVAFFDDIGQAPPCVQAALMQLFLARKVNGHSVSDFVVFIGATNRKKDRAGVSGILEPVKSRFKSIIELVPNAEDWIDWALTNKVHPDVVGYVHFKPDAVADYQPTAEMTNSCCPRTLVAASDWLWAGVEDYEMISGAIGAGRAAELMSFIKVKNSLPDLEEIIKNPMEAYVPDERKEPSALYAVVSALVHKADEDTVGNIMKYAERLPKNYNILLGRDIKRKDVDKEIQKTKAFIAWAIKHSEDIIC